MNYTYSLLNVNNVSVCRPIMMSLNMTDEFNEVMEAVGINLLEQMEEYAVYYASECLQTI